MSNRASGRFARDQERLLDHKIDTPGGELLPAMQAWCMERWGVGKAANGWFSYGARFSFKTEDQLHAFRAAFNLD